jgi:hypothetical protein
MISLSGSIPSMFCKFYLFHLIHESLTREKLLINSS